MHYLLLVLFVAGSLVSLSQEEWPSSRPQPEIFVGESKDAEFSGGEEALAEYIRKGTVNPLKKRDPSGTVIVSFIVEYDGSLSNVKVTQGLTPEADAEAIRLIEAMPKWNPEIKFGKPVRSRYSLPIEFESPKKRK